MKFLSKIKAQAMQFAILISVLVALLLSAFLLLTHVHSFFKIKSQEIILGFDIANQRLFESLEQDNTSKDTVATVIDAKTIKENIVYHGAWQKRYVEVGVHNQKVRKMAFTGSKLTEKTPNLYVEDKNSPIVVVGDSRLEGNSYLPEQGIKAGNISGKYYQGSALYYGRIMRSKAYLPKVNPEWITYLENVVKGVLVDQGDEISLQKVLANEFYNPYQIIYDSSPIILEEQKITGNIIIQSGTKIVVTSATQLTDVILIAPEIVIKNGVKGSFQSIASKTIEIGRNCYLSYPSSAILLDKKRTKKQEQNHQYLYTKPDFLIQKGTVVEGIVAYLNPKKETKNRIKTHLEITPDVEIVGEVYCQGNIDFQGRVLGSLYMQQCIARQSGSVYLNHIYNGKVLRNPVTDYAGLPFVNSKHSIAKWLY